MDDDDDFGLLCLDEELVEEDEEEQEQEPVNYNALDDDYDNDDDDDEYVRMLIEAEISFGFKSNQSFDFGDRIKCARLEAIAWILKTRAIFGFGFQTAYLSVAYLDRFIWRRSICEKTWATELLSVACLLLAAKMEELTVPAIPEFQTDEYNFPSIMIRKMEILVMTTLDWRLSSSMTTPFAFLHYFINKLHDNNNNPPPPPSSSSSSLSWLRSNIEARTESVIMATMKEINLMDYRPSVIALAAALVVVLDQRLTREAMELQMNSISCCEFLDIEDVFKCYNIMKRMERTPSKTPDFKTNSVCTKRKRLMFNDSDQS